MALSRMNKKDPTGALKWERKYEKAILKIVDKFNDDVVDAFTHMWDTGELRTLEAGKFDATRFSPFVDKLADKKLNKPAKRVVKRIVPKAYAQGEMFAKTMVEGLFNIVLGDVLGVREKVGELVLKNEIEFKGFSTETSRRINRTISDGIIDGKPKYTIVNDLRDGFEMTRNNATRIVRTETMRATNRGVKDKYRSAGIEVVKWMATIQPGRTCEECKALNGKLFPIDKTPPIPKHPRCRCTLSPVPDPDWSEVEGWDGEQVTPPKEKKKEGPLPTTKDDFERAAEIGNEQKERLVKSKFLKEDEEISDTVFDELKPSEIDALEKYDYSSSDLANYMRGKEYDLDQSADLPDEDELSDLEYIIHRIIFNSDPLPKDLQLYRGVGGVTGKTISKLDVGDVIYDKAFSSFSYRPDQAIFFTNVMRNETEGTIIKIVTTGKESGFVLGSKNGEIILDRETTIKIIKKESIVFSDKKFTVLSGVVERG